MLHAVIMAGGAGTRFWPASRRHLPKQLLPLAGDRTMIQATVDRLSGLVSAEQVLIVTNEALKDAIAEQLPEVPPQAILGEPCKRDTAPCVALAAGLIARRDPDAIMVVLPADHVIRPTDAFQAAIRDAVAIVQRHPEALVTFGIPPTYPATGYGYIERGELLGESRPNGQAYRVARFREKPTLDVARQYLEAGNFYWNAGIFVWRAETILRALREYEPEIMERIEAIVARADAADFDTVFRENFAAIQGKSIDFAVMERYPEVVVLPAIFEWDDVGNWQSLARTRGVNEDGNTIIGRHLGVNTEGCIIRSEGDHLIVTLGLKDCIVVHTPDATLVASKQDEEALRQIVPQLEKLQWNEYL